MDPLDTKGAQRDIQQRSSANATAIAQHEMLRSLTAPAERSFQKDYFARDQEADLRTEIEQLRKKLFVQDRTSADFGHLVSGASFPGGYGAQAESLQKLTSDQGRLAGVLEAKKAQKDADEAARKAAQELASAQRTVAAGLESAQRAELSGADRLRFERDNAIAQYGKTRDLVRDINKEFDIRFGIEGKAIIDQSDADMRTRAAAEARSQESQLNARSGYASRAILDTIRISGEAPAKRDEIDLQRADLQRESQLRQLESFDAKTLAQKAAVEAAKFQIESSYLTRVQEIESAGIDRGYQKQLQDLKVLVDSRLITEKAFNDQKIALEQNQQLDILKIHEKTDAAIQKSGIDSAKAIREEYQKQLDVISEQASHLLDTLFTDPSHFGKQLSETIRAAFLKPVISGLSNDIAKSLQPAIYGQGNTNGGGFSFSKMADALGIRQSTPQQDWTISGATAEGALAGYSKFSGTPVYSLRGKKNGPLGDFDSESGRINMYAAAIKDQYSADEAPWAAARTFIHEDAHALLDSKNIKALNALLPQDFVDKSIRGLVKSNHYSDSDAAREIIPRLVTNEETGASGFNQKAILREFIGALKPQDAQLAETLGSMGQATGAIPAPPGDLPAINDLLRSTRTLNDYRISGSSVGGGGFSFPMGGAESSSQFGVPTGINGLRALFTGAGGAQASQSVGQGGIFQPGGRYLSGLKSSFWNENINTGAGSAVSASSQGFGGKLEGVLTSEGAASMMVAGGVPLAMAGISGRRRGTWGGIAESTGGGALVGAGIGTMILPGLGTAIGAGIGAVAGFGIGLGEKLAGVESPENKAARIVKETYRIDIDLNMARQIVQIADSKYAKNVNIAVHSPDVRQMLGLYAQGTGQGGKFPLSAMTPAGGSLSEIGGRLYQDPSYRFGNAFVQQSPLPVAGGGNPGVYPVPQTVQLIVADGSIGNLLDGRVANTVNPGYVQNQFAKAQQGSNGRLQNSAMVQQPGLIF